VGEEIDRLRESACLVPEQREIALKSYVGVPGLVRGVAGSGKSQILVQNLATTVARLQDEDRRWPFRILVTCFNRALVPLLRRNAEAQARDAGIEMNGVELTFLHFEGVLQQVGNVTGIAIPLYRTPDGERLPPVTSKLEQLLSTDDDLADAAPWDLIYVDEAQDLDPEALRLLYQLARRDEKTGDRGFVLFYDDAQNLYGRPRPVWRDLGIPT
jgi:superfamily I DNA and RNA helicase